MTFLYLGIINKRTRVQKYILILEPSENGKGILLVRTIFSFSCPCLWTGWRNQEHLDSSLPSASPPPLFPLPDCGGRCRTESVRDGNTALKGSLGCIWCSSGSFLVPQWGGGLSVVMVARGVRVIQSASWSSLLPPKGSRMDGLPWDPQTGHGYNQGQRECAGLPWGVTEKPRQSWLLSWTHCCC